MIDVILMHRTDDGKIGVVSNCDLDGSCSEFASAAAEWPEERKFVEALKDFFKKGSMNND